jgi:hypothetical protein
LRSTVPSARKIAERFASGIVTPCGAGEGAAVARKGSAARTKASEKYIVR